MALVVSLAFALIHFAQAAEVHGVTFADKIDIGGQKLILNGAGFAPSHHHGATYAAGLYLLNKNADAENIIANPQAKVLRMVFLRAMNKPELKKMWTANYERACAPDCSKARANLNNWADLMIAVKAKSVLQLSFDEDGVTFKFEGPEPHEGHVFSKPFQKILLSSFLVHAKSDELRDGLLGKAP